MVYYAQKDTIRALADFTQAVTTSPDEAHCSYGHRAWIYAERGEFQAALADCKRALELDNTSEEAYACRARVYYLQGEYELALADCAHALALYPGCAEAYGVSGLVAYGQEQYEKALADFTRARDMGHNLFWLDCEYNEAYNKVNRI